jgi:hypothetical protein
MKRATTGEEKAAYTGQRLQSGQQVLYVGHGLQVVHHDKMRSLVEERV